MVPREMRPSQRGLLVPGLVTIAVVYVYVFGQSALQTIADFSDAMVVIEKKMGVSAFFWSHVFALHSTITFAENQRDVAMLSVWPTKLQWAQTIQLLVISACCRAWSDRLSFIICTFTLARILRMVSAPSLTASGPGTRPRHGDGKETATPLVSLWCSALLLLIFRCYCSSCGVQMPRRAYNASLSPCLERIFACLSDFHQAPVPLDPLGGGGHPDPPGAIRCTSVSSSACLSQNNGFSTPGDKVVHPPQLSRLSRRRATLPCLPSGNNSTPTTGAGSSSRHRLSAASPRSSYGQIPSSSGSSPLSTPRSSTGQRLAKLRNRRSTPPTLKFHCNGKCAC